MEANFDFEKLFKIAREELSGIDRIALAVRGTPVDIALIKIAAEVLGPNNVLVITADTGLLSESEWSLIDKACSTAEVRLSVITVDSAVLYEPGTYDYKRELFRELIHEAWMQGFETLADGCTEENFSENGNQAQHALGVISPFVGV